MIGVYLASLSFGGILILVSMLFGGADKDFDKDLDLEAEIEADLDGEADFDGEADLNGEADLDGEADIGHGGDFDKDASALGDFIWLPIFSMRFWTFGTAAFGFTGTALTLGQLPWLLVLVVSVLFGAGMGTAAATFFRMLKKDTVTGTMSTRSYVGEEARVVLPVEPGGRGKIIIELAAGDLELVATTRDGSPIARGAIVLIAGFKDGIADVSCLKTLRKQKAAQRNRKNAQNN